VSTDHFFEVSREQSAVKSAIVSKYFWSWARVMMSQAQRSPDPQIAYLDLFAGPGRYSDGTKSTPLLILEKAIQDEKMCRLLVTIFNDKDDNNFHELQAAIEQLPGIEKLKHRPIVWNNEVGSEMVKHFSSTQLAPTLFFVDPWGYKELSLQLVNSVLKNWGCDCIFFFNYNRISMGLSNPLVEEHMAALFGAPRALALRGKLEGLSSEDRESCIVEELCEALGAKEGRYVLPFSFKNDAGTRTRHHLIFVSKHVRGYTIMKDIMWKESSLHNQGVATFAYSPADKKFPLLFELFRPLDDLEGMLLGEFAGQKITTLQVFDRHQVGRPFVLANYKEVLKQMEAKGLIECSPDATRRRKNTFGDDVIMKFRPKVGLLGTIKH